MIHLLLTGLLVATPVSASVETSAVVHKDQQGLYSGAEKRKSRKTLPSRSKAPFKFASEKYNKWYATEYMWYKYGWGKHQRKSLILLWTKESGWNEHAHNGSSGAHGIPQALPGSKMASHGKNWRSNPETQIKWGLSYIKARYGTPNGAWRAFQSKGWY